MAGSPPKPPPPAPFSHPSYAELIDSYLRPWVATGDKTGEFIHEADPYGVAPGVLTGQFPSATTGDGEEAWYFFTKLQYSATDRVKRTTDTKEGTWVRSSKARPVRSGGHGGEDPQVGQSQAFTFKRRVRNERVLSGWNMVELRLRDSDTNALCKVYRNPKVMVGGEASASAGVAAAPGREDTGEEIDEEEAAAGPRLKRKAGDEDPGAGTAAASPRGKRAVGESAGAGAATTGDAAQQVEAPAEPEEPDDPSKRKLYKFL
jgi:hypothetical protein